MDKQVKLRIATIQDAAALLDIYAPYVENTAITFEYTVPSVQEFEQRISNTLQTYPYLVAEKNGDRKKIVSNIGNYFKPSKHHKFVCLYC